MTRRSSMARRRRDAKKMRRECGDGLAADEAMVEGVHGARRAEGAGHRAGDEAGLWVRTEGWWECRAHGYG